MINYTLTSKQQLTGLSPGWLSGLIDSDGSFGIYIQGSNVRLTFNLTQHINDFVLFQSFPEYFGGGSVSINRGRLVVYNLSNRLILETYLFPLLGAHPLMTQKKHDFADFKRVYAMLKRKEHLTLKGLDEIRQIKEGINRGRYNIDKTQN